MMPFLRVLQARQQQLIQERRKREEEKLLSALATPMGFHKGKPLAALVVFRACLQWRAFEADRTSVFDRIIQVLALPAGPDAPHNTFSYVWLVRGLKPIMMPSLGQDH
jgi:myosin-5